MFVSTIYSIYLYKIYPRVDHIRGTTRLLIILKWLVSRNFRKIKENETLLEEKNWKNLIVLDACRYDYFKEHFPESDYIISPGSRSEKYIQSNFKDTSEFQDVVCITANPFFKPSRFKDITGEDPSDIFFDIYPSYQNWDKNLGTVRPKKVIEDIKKPRKDTQIREN